MELSYHAFFFLFGRSRTLVQGLRPGSRRNSGQGCSSLRKELSLGGFGRSGFGGRLEFQLDALFHADLSTQEGAFLRYEGGRHHITPDTTAGSNLQFLGGDVASDCARHDDRVGADVLAGDAPVSPTTNSPRRAISPSKAPSIRTPPAPLMEPCQMTPEPSTEVMRSTAWMGWLDSVEVVPRLNIL